MSYLRVIPRDLFNEAKLLKCLGQLSLLIHDGCGFDLEITHGASEHAGFDIVQNDLGLMVTNIEVTYKNSYFLYFTSVYNSKAAYPLTFSYEDEMGEVFDENGQFSQVFKDFLNNLK